MKVTEDVERGVYCRTCGGYISLINPPGHPRDCYYCEDLGKAEPTRDNPRVRCPACGHHWDGRFGEGRYQHGRIDLDDVRDDERIGATCPECEHEFKVLVNVTYSFDSPGRVPMVLESAEPGPDPRD